MKHMQSGLSYPYTRASESPKSSDPWYSDPLLWLFPATCTLACTYDNFQVTLLLDAWKGYQEWLTGIAEVVICVIVVAVKVYESFKDRLIKFPTCRANFRIYRDTTVIVITSYVLLLDINLSNLWLSIFPAIAIIFIWRLCIKLCRRGEGGEQADSSKGDHDPTTPRSEKAFGEMVATALSFFALLGMAQLADSTADRFAISQFLLFLSTTLGALTYMMMRLPAGISPGIAPASELLHKAFLLLVLVTLHTVAAEALGEDMVWFCLPELIPVLLWYSIHLDRHSSIIGIDKIKPHRNYLTAFSAVVVALVSHLATSICASIIVACGVSGILTYYLVFMLHQWPGQQSSVNNIVAAEKQAGKDSGAATSSEVAAKSEERAGSSDDTVQLLTFWATALLIVAAVLLLLKYLVARPLGLQEPLLDTLCRDFRLCR